MVNHQFIAITSLPFVHTARRSYRLDNPVNTLDRRPYRFADLAVREIEWTLLSRGRRSRNKVSVGEPAEGSITRLTHQNIATYCGGLPLFVSNLFFQSRSQKFSKVSYNFWRWMSRLEQRWRTPLNAISVVNGRIPRIKRKLNAYCAFRITLRACLVQNVYTLISRNRNCIEQLLFVMFSCASDAFASVSYPLAHKIYWQA